MSNKEQKFDLLEFTRPKLRSLFMEELKEPAFRADQVWQWLWQKLTCDFSAMTNVAKKLRSVLSEIVFINLPEIQDKKVGEDGTTKFLLRLADGTPIETVLIPAPNRAGEIRWSQCLSTQAGCPMGCSFCATGNMGYVRNLGVSEILAQVFIGRKHLEDVHPDRPVLRNLVFMGMGEPLLNIKNLMPALQILNDPLGSNFSPRRITVSTCGIEQGLRELGDSGLAWLAVSLHAPNQELRARIMPGAAKWPLDDMLAALEKYPLKTRERITFEYLLLGGVNDSEAHARELVRILSRIRAKVNLIPYNPVQGLPYAKPAEAAVADFQKILCDKNITAILRKSRGADIGAACGQLAARQLMKNVSGNENN